MVTSPSYCTLWLEALCHWPSVSSDGGCLSLCMAADGLSASYVKRIPFGTKDEAAGSAKIFFANGVSGVSPPSSHSLYVPQISWPR